MKNTILILFILLTAGIIHAQDVDSTKSKTFDMVDSLEIYLRQWYYYTGRDTICYLEDDERKNFDTELSDSVFKERVRVLLFFDSSTLVRVFF